ncbi:hypothetical protein PsorP6_011477 [Peronosclerospora sorghi]|uniref:Uncharacterized protein n=1 Tax=Peronosclerospora sorghi TaxID=230839 RepID=A0ACC0WJ85_9STRA|nr:hypothetical protein PsorP6_011477 [Peronosclerospora sorghi]
MFHVYITGITAHTATKGVVVYLDSLAAARMVATNTLDDAERPHHVHTSSVVRSPQVSSEEEEGMQPDDGDDVDPVDGSPSLPVRARSRRRFAKSGQTSYELSFSRRPPSTRRGGEAAAVTEQVVQDALEEYRPAPAVSSLSSVLTEVMSGKTRALDNIFDTTPPQPNVTYVVEHAADGTPYVAASDGKKYFENSTIGQIYLKKSTSNDMYSGGFVPRDGGQEPPRTLAINSAEHVADANGDARKGSKALLGFKKFHLGKIRGKKGGTTTLKAVLEQDDRYQSVAVNGTDTVAHQHTEKDPSMHEQGKQDKTQPGANLLQPPKIRLLDSSGIVRANQTTSNLRVPASHESDDLTGSSTLGSSNTSVCSNSSNVASSLTKASPGSRPQTNDRPPALDASYDDDDDDNPLCQSFQSVRNVDLIRSKSDTMEKENTEPPRAAEGVDHEEREDNPDDLNASDVAGRERASSDTNNVVEFVGGFKGQLSRRSGASGLVNRKRAVRHARLTVEEQKAADLARKIRDACNRIPFEFRDEYISRAALEAIEAKRRKRARGRRVRFNPDVLCREYEVESEDEGYESPDEIVDAMQLVSKYEVVRAEDVVAASPMEDFDAYSEEGQDAGGRGGSVASSCPGEGAETDALDHVHDDPLTYSQLQNDKRMSFSDLS